MDIVNYILNICVNYENTRILTGYMHCVINRIYTLVILMNNLVSQIKLPRLKVKDIFTLGEKKTNNLKKSVCGGDTITAADFWPHVSHLQHFVPEYIV